MAHSVAASRALRKATATSNGFLLRNAVEACDEGDGWPPLSGVGSHIGNQASFDQRNFGYRKLGDLIEATGLFDTERRGNHLFLRDKRCNRKQNQ